MVHPVRNRQRPGRSGSGRPRARLGAACAVGMLALGSFSVDAAGQDDPGASSREVSKANQDLARSVAVTGREAFNAGDYETAVALFRRAYTLFPAPTVVLYEARSLEKMGRMIEAVEAYDRTTQTPIDATAPAQFAEAVAAAHQEGRELRARIPTLTLQVQGVSAHDPNLEIQINGKAIGTAQIGQALNLNPGTYHVAGSVSPERKDERQAVLAAGNKVVVSLNLSAPPPNAPAPHEDQPAEPAAPGLERQFSPFIYVAGAVGVAGLGTGVVTGIMANGKHEQAEERCPDQVCERGSSGPGAVNSFRTLRAVSTLSYGIGAAGIAAGVVLWLTADTSVESSDSASLEPWVSTDAAGIRGTF